MVSIGINLILPCACAGRTTRAVSAMMQGYGPGAMPYGRGYYGNQGDLNLTADQVKAYLEQMIRNPNLKVGDVKEKDADTIVADIVTKDKDALVQRLDFNRHNGFVQPEQ